MSDCIGTTPRWEGFANPILSWNSEEGCQPAASSKDPAGCEGSDYSPTQQEGGLGLEMMEGIIQGVGGIVGGVQADQYESAM